MALDTDDAFTGIADRADPFLQDEVMGVVLKFLLGEPSRMGFAPGAPTRKAAALAQEERGHLLAFCPEIPDGGVASTDQTADRLVHFIGNPDGGEFPGSQELCQAFGVAAVGLHVVAGPLGDQRRGDDVACLPKIDQPSV
jgi:hypothetical protein